MSETATMSPQELAEAATGAMWPRDNATNGLGMELVSVGPGTATLRMRVRSDMLNGHKTCHGGFIFALSDSTFAFACNSYNLNTVAAGCSIEYLYPGREGDILTAVGVEQSRQGKSGVYDIRVTNQDGICVALFRGKSHQIKGEVTSSFAEE